MDIFKGFNFLPLVVFENEDDYWDDYYQIERRPSDSENSWNGVFDEMMKWWVGDFSDETWEILLDTGLVVK